MRRWRGRRDRRPTDDATQLLAAIDGGYTLDGRFAEGEGAGAWRVRTADGSPAVLKFGAGPHLDFEWAARVCAVLRARGYPAPFVRQCGAFDGIGFGITDVLPGTALRTPLPEHVPQIIALVDLQRDAGLATRAPWVADIVTSVTEGRDGFCEHAAMHAYSDETRALLDRVRHVAGAAHDVDVPLTDIVHMDLTPYNTLAEGTVITGVIDWEGSTIGDAAFDLVAHSLYTYDTGLREALLTAARERTDPRALTLYASHMTLRQVDWSIRHHDDRSVAWFVRVSTDLLEAVGAE